VLDSEKFAFFEGRGILTSGRVFFIVVGSYIESESLERGLHIIPIPFGAHALFLPLDVLVVEDQRNARPLAILVCVLCGGPRDYDPLEIQLRGWRPGSLSGIRLVLLVLVLLAEE